MIKILSYGVGNVHAFKHCLTDIGIEAEIISKPTDLDGASALILPGVGSFDHAMKAFNVSGLRDPVEAKVFDEKCPILGVCVGMQMMADCSTEGKERGLGWIRGEVISLNELPEVKNRLPLPHMGWNQINCDNQGPFGKLNQQYFYFLHSYHFRPDAAGDVVAHTNYGVELVAAVSKNNIWGFQGHPEKSHDAGKMLLSIFSNMRTSV